MFNLKMIVIFQTLMKKNFIDPNPPIDEVIKAGIVPRLIYFLHQADHNLLQVRKFLTIS